MTRGAKPRPTLRESLRRVANAAVTPLEIDDVLDVFHPLRGGRVDAGLRGRIVSVTAETAESASLVIKPGRDWAGHIPGQYVRIGVDVDGVRQWRAYSLTSDTGRADGCIAITVKAIPGGKVSNHLVRHATVGTIVQLDHAAGEFTLPAAAPAKILFLTAGSGITPVMGMLRNIAEHIDDVVVVHSAPTPDDVIFGGELRMLASQGRIRLIEKHTDTDGMLGTSELDVLVDDLAERETWACGPTGMLDSLEQHWNDNGMPERLHTERFRPTVVTAGDGGTVTFTKSATVLDTPGDQTLLDAGEAAGVLMPSGCRMGICFGCVAPLRQGAVRDLRNGDITTATPGDGVLIQTCVSAAAGTCDIDL